MKIGKKVGFINKKKICATLFTVMLIGSMLMGMMGNVIVNVVENAAADLGGPDAWDYVWTNSTGIPSIPYMWLDGITGGTETGLTDDDWIGPIGMGISFTYYGTAYTDVYIMSNGWISFTDWDNWYQDVTDFPGDPTYNCAISPYSQDLDPGAAGEVYYKFIAGSPNQFVVTWDGVPHIGTSDYQTFQIVLNESGEIRFNYQTLTNPNANVGIENQDSTIGLDYDSAPAMLSSGLSIEFLSSPPPYRVVLSPDSQRDFGSPGQDVDYVLDVDNTGTDDDTYDLSNVSAWPVTFRDIGDTMDITSVFVAAGNSVNFIARVTIPPSANFGDFDNATINATSQNDTVVKDTANVNTTCLKIPTYVALFQDANPWGFTSTQDVLTANSIPFDIYSSSDIGVVDLSPYDKVIISSDQPQSFYDTTEANLGWFESYVIAGGILQFGAGSNGWNGGTWTTLPGGYSKAFVTDNTVSIDLPGHQFVTIPNSITDAELDSWGSSTHAYFDALPMGAVTVCTDSNGPCVVESVSGLGRYFAYGLIIEWGWGQGYSTILENIILCMNGTAVPLAYYLDMTPGSQIEYGFAGTDVDYILNVVNGGLNNDTYNLSAMSLWPVTFRDIADTTDITNISIASGNNSDFIARVSTPGGALPGDFDLANITAASQGDPTVNDSCLVQTQVPYAVNWSDSFELGWEAWTTEVISPSNPNPTYWEIGDPLGTGPGAAYNGTNCSGTNILSDYYPSADICLVSPYVELGAAPQILSFYHWYEMDTLDNDGGFIEISAGGGPWTQIWPVGGYPSLGGYMGGYWTDGYSGLSSGWEYDEFDLSAYATQVVRVRFHLAASDSWGWQWGWYVDEVYMGDLPPYRCELTPDSQMDYGISGQDVDYILTINNTGTSDDTYDLSNVSAWPVTFRDIGDTMDITSIFVASGATADFIARLSVPGGALPGDVESANITAASQGDPTVNDTAEIVTGVPFAAPWLDDFEFGIFGGSTGLNWSASGPAFADVGMQTSQSGIYSMYTSGGVVSVTTWPVDTSGLPSVEVKCWVRRGDDLFSENPDLNEDLEIYYRNDIGNWILLETFLGSGTAGEIHIRTYSLPADALHTTFQLRFNQTGGSGLSMDYWHIDDVYIGPPPPYEFELLPVINISYGLAGGNVDYIFTINNTGTNDDTYDLSSISVWPVTFRDIGDTMDITSIFVTSGTTADFIARVGIPGGALPGDFDLADITATSQGDPMINDTAQIQTQVPYTAGWFDGFELGWDAWTTGIINPSSPNPTYWEIGDPMGTGPGTAYNGNNCSGTNIISDYYPSADICLASPYVELGAAPQILSFYHWYEIDTSDDDGGFVEISADGGPWAQIWPIGGYPSLGGYMGGYLTDGYSGLSSGWEYDEFDLSAYATQVVQVRFHFAASDWWGWQWGWYVDDVYLGDLPPYRCELTPDYQISVGNPGTNMDYILTVSNTGANDDSYDLSAVSFWPVTFRNIADTMDITSIFVSAGNTADFIVRVSVPGGAIPGDVDIANITATSQNDPLVNEYAEVETNVPIVPPWFDGTESGIGPWQTWDDGDGTVWELGNPSPWAFGPPNAYSPSNCWGTNIIANYTTNGEATLTTPYIDLSLGVTANLAFRHWYDINGGWNDGGWVEVSDDFGSSWTRINPVGGYPDFDGWWGMSCYAGWSGGWVQADFDISAYLGSTILIQFHFFDVWWDGPLERAGWYIDDVYLSVTGVSPYVIETIPPDGATGVPVDQNIVVIFSESMNPGVIPTLTQIAGPPPTFIGWFSTYLANDTAIWSHIDWTLGQDVNMSISGGEDLDGNPSPGYLWNFTVTLGVTTATAIGPIGGPTNMAGITIIYSTTGSPASVDLWYTADTSAPYTWTFIDRDDPADGSYAWTVPADGPYGWFTNSTDEAAPTPVDAPEASYYIYDGISPVISGTNPADTDIDVLVNQPIIVTFNEPIDTATWSFICSPDPGGWIESWNATNEEVTLTHPSFALGMVYNLQVLWANDTAGNLLAAGLVPNPWSFTTELTDARPPTVVSAVPTGVGVAVGANIVITFNESMNTTSVENAFSYSDGTSIWDRTDGTVNWNAPLNNTMTFNPTANLDYSRTYTVTLNGSIAKDINDNTLDGNRNGISDGSPDDDHTWSFTTSAPPDTTPPTSSIGILSPYLNSLTFPVPYTANDPSGIKHVELFYTTDAGATWLKYGTTFISSPISFTASGEGEYGFYLVATDNSINENRENEPISGTSPDETTIVDITPPIIDAGNDVAADLEFIQDATASDVISGISTYEWTKVSGPGTITFGSPAIEDTTVSADVGGTYVIRLRVTDNAGNSAFDEFTLVWTVNLPGETGDIEGRVVDADGNGIEEAVVRIQGTSYVTITDANGDYSFTDIPVGDYTIIVEKSGHKTETKAIEVAADQTTDVPTITLPPKPKEEAQDFMWIALILVIIFLVIAIVVAILLAKRRKKEPELPEEHETLAPEAKTLGSAQRIGPEEYYPPPPQYPKQRSLPPPPPY